MKRDISFSARSRRREVFMGILFILPWILGLLIFTLYPVVASFILSFTRTGEGSAIKWVGLDNYITAFREPDFFRAILNTLILSLIGIPVAQIMSLVAALLLNVKMKFQGIFRTIFFLPSVVPAVATGLLWKWILNPRLGPINTFLDSIGLSGPGWLADPAWVKPSLIIMSFWGIGGTMVIYLAGLQNIPTEYYEAAKLDGAGSWACLKYITLPMLRPVTLFNTIMAIITSFQSFSNIIIMLDMDGGMKKAGLVYGLYIYTNAFRDFKMGYSSALAWILLAFTFVSVMLTYKFFNRSGDQEVS